jgi:hypothetical protein
MALLVVEEVVVVMEVVAYILVELLEVQQTLEEVVEQVEVTSCIVEDT